MIPYLSHYVSQPTIYDGAISEIKKPASKPTLGKVGSRGGTGKVAGYYCQPKHTMSLVQSSWCRGRDSNPQGSLRRILSPLRLPFRHPGVGRTIVDASNVTVKRPMSPIAATSQTLGSWRLSTNFLSQSKSISLSGLLEYVPEAHGLASTNLSSPR